MQSIMKNKRETIRRPKQLTCQLLGGIEKLLEDTVSEREEIDHLKRDTEQQQNDIDRLIGKKHVLFKRLRLQIKNTVEKLTAIHESMQFLKIQMEIYRRTLEGQYNELIDDRQKLGMIRYYQTKLKEYREQMKEVKRDQEITEKTRDDYLLSLIEKNNMVLVEAMQTKKTIDKKMDIKQETKQKEEVISHYLYQMYHIKLINKMKQGWTKGQPFQMKRKENDTSETVKMNLSKIQEEMEKRWEVLEEVELQLEEQQGQKTASYGMEIIKSDFQKQRVNTTHWEMEIGTNMQKQNTNLENQLEQVQSEECTIQNTRTKIQTDSGNIEKDKHRAQAEINARMSEQGSSDFEIEVKNTDIEIVENSSVKRIEMSRRAKEKLCLMMEETESDKQDISGRQVKTEEQMLEHIHDRFDDHKVIIQQVDRTRDIIQHKEDQLEEDSIDPSNKIEVNTDLKRGNVKEIRNMLCKLRKDAEQSRKDFTEEKSQIRWINFRVKKKRRQLDQRLERTMRERDEVEIMKVNIQQQRKEVEQKMEDTITTIQTMSEIKSNIEKAAGEINITKKDILKVQIKMNQNKEEVKKNMEKMTSLKAQYITLEDLHQSEEVKEQENMHPEHRKELHFPPVDMKEKKNVEETLMDDDQTSIVIHVREMEEVENQMSKLKEKEDKTREQIKCAIENMEEKNKEIKSLIIDMNILQSQKTEIESGLQMITDNTDAQRLRAEIYKTQEIIRLINRKLQNHTEESNIIRYYEDKESKINRLQHDMKLFQELLKLAKIPIQQSKIYQNKKRITAAKKQKRKRNKKKLRERDELDILKIKLQRQTDKTEQNFEKIAKVVITTKHIFSNIRLKFENIEIIMREIGLRTQLDDLNFMIKAAKQEPEKIRNLITQGKAELVKVKHEIWQCKAGEHTLKKTEIEERDVQEYTSKNKIRKKMFQLRSENVKLKKHILATEQKIREIEQLNFFISEQIRGNIEMLNQQIQFEMENVRIGSKAEAVIEKLNHLRTSMERNKQEIIDMLQMFKGEIKEMEQKSELQFKKRESNQLFEKGIQKMEDSGMKSNELEREPEIWRKEARKSRRELEKREENNMREVDETEIWRLKLQCQKEELDNEKQRLKDKTTLFQKCKHILENNPLKNIREEVKKIHKKSKPTDYIINHHNIRQDIHVNLETIRSEMANVENVRVYLWGHREILKAFKTDNKTIRGNISKIKYWLEMDSKKRTMCSKAEMDDIDHNWMNIQKHGLKKKSLQKKQEDKNIFVVDKYVLKMETQKRKKELDQRLERINRERDDLEIMKLKMQREIDRSKVAMGPRCIQFANFVQKHWKLIQTGIEEIGVRKKQSRFLKDQKQHMKAQAKKITKEREKVQQLKMDIQRQKEIIRSYLENMQQMQTNKQEKLKNIKANESIKKERERNIERCEDILLRQNKLGTKKEILLKYAKHQKKDHNDMKRRNSDRVSEKRRKMPRTERKPTQNKVVQCGKGLKDQERNLKSEKIPLKHSTETLVLHLNTPEVNIKKRGILKSEIKNKMKSFEALKGKLHHFSKTREEIVRMKVDKLGQHTTNVQKLCIVMEKKQTGLNENTRKMIDYNQGFMREKQTLLKKISNRFQDGNKKEKQDCEKQKTEMTKKLEDQKNMSFVIKEKLKLDIKKRMSLLKQDVKERKKKKKKIEMTACQLKNLKKYIKKKIGEMVFQVGSGKEKVHSVTNNIADNKIKRKTKELENINKSIMAERQELKRCANDLNKKKMEIAWRLNNIRREKRKFRLIKSSVEEFGENMFHEINREIGYIKVLVLKLHAKNDLFKINTDINHLKREELELKKDDFKTKEQELETIKMSVLAEIQDVELLREDLDKKKEEIAAVMITISGEQEQVCQMKSSLDMDWHRLDIEKVRLEGERSELKTREDQLSKEMKSIETLKRQLKLLNERMNEDKKKKMQQLQENHIDVVILYTEMTQKLEAQNVQNENVACSTELIQREKTSLISILSDVVIQKQNIECQGEQKFELIKQHANKLKAQLRQERNDLERESQKIKTDKLDLELLRSDILKQRDILQQEQHDMKTEQIKLETKKIAFKENKELGENMFHEINREIGYIKALVLKLHAKDDKFKIDTDINHLKQKELELKKDDFKTKKQELETIKMSVLAEIQDVELLREDLDKKKEEIAAVRGEVAGPASRGLCGLAETPAVFTQ
ncbi:uncharacterized protein AB9W97_009401 [Spinachia spinachia]